MFLSGLIFLFLFLPNQRTSGNKFILNFKSSIPVIVGYCFTSSTGRFFFGLFGVFCFIGLWTSFVTGSIRSNLSVIDLMLNFFNFFTLALTKFTLPFLLIIADSGCVKMYPCFLASCICSWISLVILLNALSCNFLFLRFLPWSFSSKKVYAFLFSYHLYVLLLFLIFDRYFGYSCYIVKVK